MKAKYNPAPWKLCEAGQGKPFRIEDSNGNLVAKLTELDRANAERIVLSVNYAEGKLNANV